MLSCNDQMKILTRSLVTDGRHQLSLATLFLITVVQSSQADLSLGDVSDGHGIVSNGMDWDETGWDGIGGMGWERMGWDGMEDPHALPPGSSGSVVALKSRQSHIPFPSRGRRQPHKPSRTAIPVRTACPKASLHIMSHAARVVSSTSHWMVSIRP